MYACTHARMHVIVRVRTGRERSERSERRQWRGGDACGSVRKRWRATSRHFFQDRNFVNVIIPSITQKRGTRTSPPTPTHTRPPTPPPPLTFVPPYLTSFSYRCNAAPPPGLAPCDGFRKHRSDLISRERLLLKKGLGNRVKILFVRFQQRLGPPIGALHQ